MVKARQDPPPEPLDGLRGQIQYWRQSRKVPGPMPGELWDAAVAMAKEFGVCKMSRALTLDYTALLRIHLEAGRGMEAAGIVAAFLGARG